MNRSLYYGSIFCLSIVCLILLLIRQSQHKLEEQVQSEIISISTTPSNTFQTTATNFTKGGLAFHKHTFPYQDDTAFIDFACTDCREGYSKFCLKVNGNQYIGVAMSEKDSIIYSRGTYYLNEDTEGEIYYFTSKNMPSPHEAYYRSIHFDFTGSFIRDVGITPIQNWTNLPDNQAIYEAWLLERKGSYFQDFYTDNIFE